MKKLHFSWGDNEAMVLTSSFPFIGINYGKKIIGAYPYIDTVIWGKDRYLACYIPDKIYKKTIKLSKKFLDKSYAEQHFQKSANLRKNYNEFIEEFRKLQIEKLDTREIIKLLTKIWDFMIIGLGFFCSSQPELLHTSEKRLAKLLSVKYSDYKKIMDTLLIPIEFDEAQKQEIDWITLVGRKNELTWNDFMQHCFKYPFLLLNSYDIGVSFKTLESRFQEDKRQYKELQQHVKNMRKIKRKAKKEQKNFFNELKNPEIEYLAWLFQKHAIDRMQLKYTWAGSAEFLFYNLYQEVARRIGENYYTLVNYYRLNEIINALKAKGKLSQDEINRRKKKFLFYSKTYLFCFKKGKVYFCSGQEAIDMAKKKYPELLQKTEEDSVKGATACQGKATGKVLILHGESLEQLADLNKTFQKGDILMAGMTQPNMLPLMMKAGAIVTDEGGLTSHAAVISREFKIPCIVGTHKCTKVFKTNDFVEVDADKGVVKLLERK